MDGILLIDKPKGWTSFDVVNYIRSIIARYERKKPKQVKVGHTGTLDPEATGLLVICIGKYTKLVPELIGHDKNYKAEITLGATSTTGDSDGKILANKDSNPVSTQAVNVVLENFRGEIEQVPPKHSAIKVNGKRAYKLAREGKDIKLEPRKVTIHSLEIKEYNWPLLKIDCNVSKGTYIRSLAEDIGKELGVGGYLSKLRRTTVGKYKIEDSLEVKGLDADVIRDNLLHYSL